MEIDIPIETFDAYIARIEREKRALREELDRCRLLIQGKKSNNHNPDTISNHQREVRMVWGHYDQIKNYAKKLEVENIELKLENERLESQRNIRKADFHESEEQQASHKRFKKAILETEQKRQRPGDWDISGVAPFTLSGSCTHCNSASVAFMTEHYFCKRSCYSDYYGEKSSFNK